MNRTRMAPPAILAIGIAVGTALGLTTYTLPNHGGPSYGEVADLLRRSLGDSPPSIPGPSEAFPLDLTVTTDSPRAHPAGPRDEPVPRANPGAWLHAAIDQDPAAVREWLGPLVFATAEVRGDTIVATWWRPTWRSGCPVLSRLEAVSTGRSLGETQVVRLTGTCPRLSGD